MYECVSVSRACIRIRPINIVEKCRRKLEYANNFREIFSKWSERSWYFFLLMSTTASIAPCYFWAVRLLVAVVIVTRCWDHNEGSAWPKSYIWKSVQAPTSRHNIAIFLFAISSFSSSLHSIPSSYPSPSFLSSPPPLVIYFKPPPPAPTNSLSF